MPESARKEIHLLSGLWLQVFMIVALGFVYIQAIRQVKYQQELYGRLQEQLVQAREEAARHAVRPDLANLQTQVAELKSFLVPIGQLDSLRQRLEKLAREQFRVQELQVRMGEEPVKHLSVPLEAQEDFEVDLYPLELSGTGETRQMAQLMERISDRSAKVLCALVAMDLKASESGTTQPTRFSLRWLVAVEPSEKMANPPEPPPSPPAALASKLQWGPRKEPFRSPFQYPSAFQMPKEKLQAFRVTGVLWDPVNPTCVINDFLLKPGEQVDGYRLVLVTPKAVLLEGPEGELLLPTTD